MTRPEDAKAKVDVAEARAKAASHQAGEALESLKAAGMEKAEELKVRAEDLKKQGEGMLGLRCPDYSRSDDTLLHS